MNKNSKKTVLLCILDGWGIGENDNKVNAIFAANTPNYDEILKNYPHSKIGASGEYVGLPSGQIGNSEVGHVTIGSGRVIYQDLPKINNSISNDELQKNTSLQALIKNCQKNTKKCHLLGLLSNGGVHSHEDHLIYLAKLIASQNIEVNIHAFLDGRDVGQKSAISSIKKLQESIKNHNNIKIATISGRYYAMDRDNNWDRIKLSYDSIVLGRGKKSNNIIESVKESYNNNITDEFFIPTVIQNYQGINNGDALIVANFRSDRIRQISSSLLEENFDKFKAKKLQFSSAISMTHYSDELSKYYQVLFPKDKIKNSLGEVLQNNNMSQLRIAETEKYAHVTFFFSGGKEDNFKGEDRILIDSPKVATYDLKPEMSADSVTAKLTKAIDSNKYDFIVVNYANPDMVGHSGIFAAAKKACEVIDEKLGILKEKILENDGHMIITADHGNIENMLTSDNKPHTAHSNNLVPFILIGNNVQNFKLKDGSLANISPTILEILKAKKPSEMNENSLIL